MVPILDDNSEIGANVRRHFCYLICGRHLTDRFISKSDFLLWELIILNFYTSIFDSDFFHCLMLILSFYLNSQIFWHYIYCCFLFYTTKYFLIFVIIKFLIKQDCLARWGRPLYCAQFLYKPQYTNWTQNNGQPVSR